MDAPQRHQPVDRADAHFAGESFVAAPPLPFFKDWHFDRIDAILNFRTVAAVIASCRVSFEIRLAEEKLCDRLLRDIEA